MILKSKLYSWLPNEQIEQVSEQFLNENGENESKGELVTQWHHCKPHKRREKQRNQPEKRTSI